MPSIEDLIELASRLDVRVAWVRLDGEAGRWVPDRSMILLDSRLVAREEVCTLAHELGHAFHRHPASGSSGPRADVEAQADEYAAMLLISAEDYRRAEVEVGCSHPGALAEVLDVDARIVEARQRILDGGPPMVSQA